MIARLCSDRGARLAAGRGPGRDRHPIATHYTDAQMAPLTACFREYESCIPARASSTSNPTSRTTCRR